jgi:hypothetical protein
MGGALAGLVILLIGDSHVAMPNYLITSFHGALEAQGATVNSYGMCGGMAQDWVMKVTAPCRAERHGTAPPQYVTKSEPTWLINDLIDQTHPNLVLVELGDTMAGYDKPDLPKPWIYEQVHQLTGRIAAHNIACIWIGPIWGNPASAFHKTDARVTEMSQFLAQSVAPCGFIDSTRFARPGEWPTSDGQHLLQDGYRRWSAALVASVIQMKGQLHLSAQ